ncbi:MAG TPA: HD domain-containing protein [Gemmatimonadaceae bacterium]|jgi:(p)ppGpp synthase/HD superfamily hydrolase|nr:HD domain-containing protein [Gemmatimonadaceae bacterium]
MLQGYSDRINHALAFAAKHDDREVRKGTRLPYGTHGANVAVILTKYDQDEDTVVAGILQGVVADFVRDRFTAEMLQQRVSDKFGERALHVALAASMRANDDDGVELSHDEQRDDFLVRLTDAADDVRWVSAADAIHTAGTILADLQRTIDPDSVWSRYHAGKAGTVGWFRRVYEQLHASGFDAPIMRELARVVEALEQAGGS